MADLQKRKQQLESEIATKTDRLLVEQGVAVDKEATIATKRLRELRTAIDSAASGLEDIRNDIQLATQKYTMVEETRDTLQRGVDILTIDHDNLQTRNKLLKKAILDQQRQLDFLNNQVTDLLNQQIVSEEKVGDLKQEQVGLETTIADLRGELTTLQERSQTAETELDAKLHLKKIQLDEFITYEKQTRSDLVAREMAIDDREQIVTIRERKVLMDEQSIQHNAALLDL